VGHSDGLSTEVVEGLAEGQRVIVYPGDKVVDGSRIAPIQVAH
jgi:HlyD family secretion protein